MSTFTAPNSHTANMLASMAGCSSPDNATSPGATFLERVQSATVEAVRWSVEHDEGATLDGYRDAGTDTEIADGAVPIYAHALWSTFVDLAAYSEDLGDVGGSSGDMEQDARVALYMIAERLVHAILEDISADDDDDDDDDDEA